MKRYISYRTRRQQRIRRANIFWACVSFILGAPMGVAIIYATVYSLAGCHSQFVICG